MLFILSDIYYKYIKLRFLILIYLKGLFISGKIPIFVLPLDSEGQYLTGINLL